MVRLVTSLLAISPLYLPVSPHISLYLPAQVRLVTSLLACFCKLFDTAGVLPRFEEGNYTSAYPYLVIINTASQCWAARCPLTPKTELYTLHPHPTPHPNPNPNY